MLISHKDISFKSGPLTLEGVLHLPKGGGPFPGVAVCHPHPRFGGDMTNGLVVTMCRMLCDAGIGALRFNFRGVGRSEGEHDRGIGEVSDAREAIGYLSLHDDVDASRIGIAGYSFGASAALEAAAGNEQVQAIASIACPLRPFTSAGVLEMLQPKLLVLGESDHDFPKDQFRFLAQRFSDPKQVELIGGADHFFAGHASVIGELVTAFFTGAISC